MQYLEKQSLKKHFSNKTPRELFSVVHFEGHGQEAFSREITAASDIVPLTSENARKLLGCHSHDSCFLRMRDCVQIEEMRV